MTIPAPANPSRARPADGVDAAIALASCGPADHGITRLARQIARAARDIGFKGAVLHEPDPAGVGGLVDRLPAGIRLLHLHVNDWLFADQRTGADERIAALAARLNGRRVAFTVTLHDLPQVSDGPVLFARRTNTYRAILRNTGGVVLSSEHERSLLTEALSQHPGGDLPGQGDPAPADIGVIPLPIDSAPPGVAIDRQESGTAAPTVGIFGYLYPGKGHREVLDELSGMRPAVTVLAIGRPSERHADLLPDLLATAEHGGIGFRCTGYIAEADLLRQLREVRIPLAPHTHVSASGSINSWIAAGRRPLVPAGRYVGELNRRLPGAVCVYRQGELRPAIEFAVTNPDSTWLPAGFLAGPTTDEVALSYLEWLRRRVTIHP